MNHSNDKKQERPYRVLSIDGGGIRGIIPAMILAEIEDRTGKPISESFDFISGTSTGGIIALGLAIPDSEGKPKYSAQDLVQLYQKNGDRIFKEDFWTRVKGGGGMFNEKYSFNGVESVLKEYFGEAEMKDLLVDVLITSYDLGTRRPFFFKSEKARKDPKRNPLVWQAARATSAAPTYFEPFRLETDDDLTYYSLIDGGVFANNPSMCAFAEVTRMGYHNLFFTSLGTGEMSAQTIDHEKAKDFGVLEWIKPLIDIMMDGNSDTVSYQMSQVLEEGGSEYIRMQANLNKDNADMDNVKESNIRQLKIAARNLMEDNSKDLRRICDFLKRSTSEELDL